jgi:hypothetical protein
MLFGKSNLEATISLKLLQKQIKKEGVYYQTSFGYCTFIGDTTKRVNGGILR